MGAGVSLLVGALLAASSGDGDDELLVVDAPERSRLELEAARLEQLVGARAANTPELSIARGDTVFIEVEVPVEKAPRGALDARISRSKVSPELSIAPWISARQTAPVAPGEPAGAPRATYGVRVSTRAPLGRLELSAELVIFDRASGLALGTRELRHAVTVTQPPAAAADLVALHRRAYLYHQTLAQEAWLALPAMQVALRRDRVEAPPPLSRLSTADASTVERFVHHRLRADIARQRLVAVAGLGAGDVAEAAVLALGSLSRRPSGGARRASVIDGQPPGAALEVAAALLERLELDEAEGIVDRVRAAGNLSRDELLRATELGAAILVVRGREDEGRVQHGRALCLDPAASPQLRHAALRAVVGRSLERERVAKGACTQRLAISTISAERRVGPAGPAITVRAVFGPDPRRLITGGDLELWGPAGKREGLAVRASHDGTGMGLLEAGFADDGTLESFAGQLLVKVRAREASGVVIATAGEPTPSPIALGEAREEPGFEVPWWLLALVAGAALAGAATTAIVLDGRAPEHGIGPITAEF